jgi:hypothetical protein
MDHLGPDLKIDVNVRGAGRFSCLPSIVRLSAMQLSQKVSPLLPIRRLATRSLLFRILHLPAESARSTLCEVFSPAGM